MRTIFTISLTICVVIVCLSRADESKPAAESDSREVAREDLKKLQGTWDRVSMELEGKQLPAEMIKGWTAAYEGDRLTLRTKDGVYRHGIVTLDPSRTPKATNTWDADGPFADQTVPGIYEINGDTMKVCFAKPGQKRPTEFTTKKGPGFLYCEYKRKNG